MEVVSNSMEVIYQIAPPESEVELVGDNGEVIRNINIGDIPRNSTRNLGKVTVKNVVGYEVRNVTITIGDLNLVKGTLVEVSTSPTFERFGRGLRLRRLIPGEECEIYMRVRSIGDYVGKGSFNLRVFMEATAK